MPKYNLKDFDWEWLFQGVNNKTFEKQIDENLYPLLQEIDAVNGKSKLKSKHLKIQSLQYQFNPDWDEDVILQLFKLFGEKLKWTPPEIPNIINRIEGKRSKVPLAYIKEKGLMNFWGKRYKINSGGSRNKVETFWSIFN